MGILCHINQYLYGNKGEHMLGGKRNKLNFTKNDELIICEKYRSGMTCNELAKEYCISYGPILKILHRNNEPVIFRQPKNNRTKTNHFNENFFIEKNAKLAYFMGFVLADGCLKNNPINYTYSMKIAVAEKDRAILDMFCEWTGFDPIHLKIDEPRTRKSNSKNYVCQRVYSIIFSSKRLFTQDFSEWGIVPNKTYVGITPTITDKELLIPFLLGLIDGDGGLFFNNKRRMFQLTCHQNLIKWFEKTIKQLGYDGSYKLILPKDKCWGRFQILRKLDIIKLGRLLNIINYEFIMDRKWNELKISLHSTKPIPTTETSS